jgi:hypothetical protein
LTAQRMATFGGYLLPTNREHFADALIQSAGKGHEQDSRTGLINPYPARQAASIVAFAAFNVDWVSRAILPFAIKLRNLAFRVVVE